MCGDGLLEKQQQYQELVLQNCVITMVNSTPRTNRPCIQCLPLHRWHLHQISHCCLWMCNEWHSKCSYPVPSKHICNWYNIMLRKNKQVHQGDGFLWFFAISVLIDEHHCTFTKAWNFQSKRGPIILELALLQEFIKDQPASHLDTLAPPNRRPEITLCKCNHPN